MKFKIHLLLFVLLHSHHTVPSEPLNILEQELQKNNWKISAHKLILKPSVLVLQQIENAQQTKTTMFPLCSKEQAQHILEKTGLPFSLSEILTGENTGEYAARSPNHYTIAEKSGTSPKISISFPPKQTTPNSSFSLTEKKPQ